jgi:hypothetical protein
MKFTAIFPPLLLLTSAYAKPPAKPATDPMCSTIETCRKKGEDVWKIVLDAQKKGADTPGLSKQYKDHYEPRTEKEDGDVLPNAAASEVEEIGEFMNLPGLGVHMPKTMKMVEIDWPAYQHFYSNGVIVGSMKFKEHDQVDKNHQLHWNVIAFEGYLQAKLKPENLMYVITHHVTDAETIKVIEEVYKEKKKDKGQKKWETWTLADHRDVFMTLLGTQQGNGAAFILSDYAKTLSHKTIKAVHTIVAKYNAWDMVVEYATAK